VLSRKMSLLQYVKRAYFDYRKAAKFLVSGISQQLRITDYAVQDAADRAVRFLLERTARADSSTRKPTLYL
jgi:hypothetical protein